MQLVPQDVRRNWEKLLDAEKTRAFQSIFRPIVPLEPKNVRPSGGEAFLDLAERMDAATR